MPPDLIAGRYRVQREVGRGGMGAVWLCRDERLGRDVAVKQVGGLPGESSMHLARALREARHSAALNHPNVVAMFDALEEGDHVWLVMEYVPSRTLDQMVRADGPIDPVVVARIGAQVADGLAAAHALDVVHRDVKPSNVLVRTDDGRALIADFGIARTVGQEQLTRSGLVTGTPTYFAPELARGAEPSPASDVWALGMSLFVAVEGTSPYDEQANAIATLNQIASQPPPDPTRAGPLTEPLRRMLDPDAETRWTMAEAAAALREVASAPPPEAAQDREPTREVPRPAPPPPPPAELAPEPEPEPAPEPAPEPTSEPTSEPAPASERSRRGVLVAVAVVVLLAAVAGVGWWLTRDSGEEAASPDRTGSSAPATRDSTPEPAPESSAGETPESPPESTPEGDPEPSTTPETTPDAPDPAPADSPEALVTDYYGLLPEDVDTSWAMLSPELQAEVGRDSFVGFWATIDDVTVDDVEVDGTVVRVTITYSSGGGSEQETRQLTVEEQGGELLITDDSGAV